MDLAHLVQAGIVRGWARSPALHYLLLGGLLFAGHSRWRGGSPGSPVYVPKTIVISAAQVAELRREWHARHGQLPDGDQLRTVIDHAVDEEVLYREALSRGLDRDDEVVRQRLVSLMEFLSKDGAVARDGETLYREALRLGLDRTDLVVRRHLVQLMRLLARRPEVPAPVTDAELQALLDREPERWRKAGEVTLTHVFLSAHRRGAALERDARDLLERLRRGRVDTEKAPLLGDPFPLGYTLRHVSDRHLGRIFGAPFARALAQVNSGEWSEPIRSSYGQHLVWIHEKLPPRMPPLDTIRPRLLQQLRDQRGEERARARLRRWRAGYEIQVADAERTDLPFEPAPSPPATDFALPRPQSFLGD